MKIILAIELSDCIIKRQNGCFCKKYYTSSSYYKIGGGVKKINLLLSLVGLLLLSTSTAFSLPIENGSFETGDLTDWTIDRGFPEIVTTATAYNGNLYTPTDGIYMAKLTPNGDDSLQMSRIWQGAEWNVGDRLVFDWAFLGMDLTNYDNAGNFDNIDACELWISPVNSADFLLVLADTGSESNYGEDYTDTGWITFSYTFQEADFGSINWAIYDQNEMDSIFLLDNIRIESRPVPEPSTFILLGLGFGALGFVVHWQKNKI